jgi:hypothetical protein
MSFLDRFAADTPPNPASLQLLFADLTELSATGLTAAVRDYHPTLAAASVEVVDAKSLPADKTGITGSGPPPLLLGLVTWGDHVVKLVAFDAPMPPNAVESCLRPALLPPDFKDQARRHRAHVLLYYAGTNTDPLEHLVAVAGVAGALTHFGAIVTLNEEARAAVASFALTADDDDEDMLATLRGLPVPFLYGGFVKMELTDVPGVWVRTFACGRLGLPNLAYHSPTHADGERLFHLFSGVLGYLRETGLTFEPNELVRIDETSQVRVREPNLMEWWLESNGPLWVLEPVETP